MKSLFLSMTAAVFISGFANAAANSANMATHMAGHLQFSKGTLHAHLSWEKGPKEGDDSVLLVEFKNGKNHTPVEIESQLTVGLWAPEMHHGSTPTVVTQVKEIEQKPVVGTYRVSKINFLMEGVWELRFTLTGKDGAKETQTWKITVK